ncbi:MAG: Crp/Fnr family transcriptional regulator [Moorellales bacterium]
MAVGDQVMLLRKGSVITLMTRPDGRQKGIEYLSEGDVIGLGYLFTQLTEPDAVMVYTKTPVEVCLLPTRLIEELCQSCLDLSNRLVRDLSRRFRSLVKHIEHMSLDTSEERVSYLLACLGHWETRNYRRLGLTHEELALLAGLNRVTVTRVIGSLANQGRLGYRTRARLRSRLTPDPAGNPGSEGLR